MADHPRTWIVYAKVIPEKTGIAPPNAEGAFVECYVPASSIEDSLRLARAALEADGYRVMDVDKCLLFEDDDWDDENDPEGEVRASAHSATSKGEFPRNHQMLWSEADQLCR